MGRVTMLTRYQPPGEVGEHGVGAVTKKQTVEGINRLGIWSGSVAAMLVIAGFVVIYGKDRIYDAANAAYLWSFLTFSSVYFLFLSISWVVVGFMNDEPGFIANIDWRKSAFYPLVLFFLIAPAWIGFEVASSIYYSTLYGVAMRDGWAPRVWAAVFSSGSFIGTYGICVALVFWIINELPLSGLINPERSPD